VGERDRGDRAGMALERLDTRIPVQVNCWR
jgi:hypothetical protein